MKISIIGTGYVGSVTGLCLADLGNQVIFVGRDPKKIELIGKGIFPIFEPELDTLIEKNRTRILATGKISDAVHKTDLTMICVGTPTKDDGTINLDYVTQVSKNIGEALKTKSEYHTVVVKSTVLPGTTEKRVLPLIEQESGRRCGQDFGICMNPEFLREGSAVKDFFNPDRIVIGIRDEHSEKILKTLYSPLQASLFISDIKTAEMIKYVSNAFLATKISFSNEIGNVCKMAGIDVYEVFSGVGLDKRIGPHFFRAGVGFGGSCLPKDIYALISYAKASGIEPRILNAVIATNESQPSRMIALLKKHLNPQEKKIGILGLAFKPDTDDIRDSRAIPLIQQLLNEGAEVIAYDPLAMKNFQQIVPSITYAATAKDILRSDAILIVTEWKEFEDLDYSGKIVIDGRKNEKAKKDAKMYEGVCW